MTRVLFGTAGLCNRGRDGGNTVVAAQLALATGNASYAIYLFHGFVMTAIAC